MKTSNTTLNALTTVSKTGLTYNPSTGKYFTTGYTSNAGNTYFSTLKAEDNIIIQEHVGQGYKYLFLNGISVYALVNNKLQLIDKIEYHNCIYAQMAPQAIAKRMIEKKVALFCDKGILSITNADIQSYIKQLGTKQVA